MRFYRVYAGEDYLSYDQVYLVGAMHTLVLLLFYVPVRMKFNSLEIVQDDKAATAAAQTGNKLLSNLYEGILTLLVTASLLFTSLFQKLISGAFS